MEKQIHQRFLSANQELRCFLRRLESVVNGTATVTEEDLDKISLRLMTLAPQVGDASRGETLDSALQSEVAEYVKDIASLRNAMTEARRVMKAGSERLNAKKRSTGGLPDWTGRVLQTS